jgi:hypothetical protein
MHDLYISHAYAGLYHACIDRFIIWYHHISTYIIVYTLGKDHNHLSVTRQVKDAVKLQVINKIYIYICNTSFFYKTHDIWLTCRRLLPGILSPSSVQCSAKHYSMEEVMHNGWWRLATNELQKQLPSMYLLNWKFFSTHVLIAWLNTMACMLQSNKFFPSTFCDYINRHLITGVIHRWLQSKIHKDDT